MTATPDPVLEELVALHGRAGTPFGVYLLWSDEPAAELARAIEREVFLEVFGNTRELLEAEYGRYEPASLFMLVIDHEKLAPAGVMRVVTGSLLNKTLDDIEHIWGVSVSEAKKPDGQTD